MAYVTGLTAQRMIQIESETIKSGYVNSDGVLVLVRRDDVELVAGRVSGEAGVGISNITPFYMQLHVSALPPSPPMVLEPSAESPWKMVEPPFEPDTNLYVTTRIVYTDNTFKYTPSVLSSSYTGIGQAGAAAAEAIEKALAAEEKALEALEDAQSAVADALASKAQALEAFNLATSFSGDIDALQTEIGSLTTEVSGFETALDTAATNAANARTEAKDALDKALALGNSVGSLLINGNFDVLAPNGVPMGWELPNSTNRFYATDSPRSGSRSLRMVSTTAEYTTRQIDTVIGTRPNRFYAIEGYVKMAVKGAVQKVGFRIKQQSSSGSVLETKAVEIPTANLTLGSWVRVFGIVEMTNANAIGGEFSVYLGPGTGGNYYVDDIMVVDVTEAMQAKTTADEAASELIDAKQRLSSAESQLLLAKSRLDTVEGVASTAGGKLTVSASAPTTANGQGKPVGAIWEVMSDGVSESRYKWDGTKWSQIKAGPNFIGEDAIGTAHIADLAVGTAQIAKLAVTDAQLGSASIAKLTVPGGAEFNLAVVQKLLANQAFIDRLVAERAIISGPSNLIPNGDINRGSGAPWDPLLVYQTTDKPTGLPAALTTAAGRGSMMYPNGPDSWFDVMPNSKYRFEIWLKASLPNSRIYLEFFDPDGATPFVGSTEEVAGVTKPPSSARYSLDNMDVPTTWTKYALIHTTSPTATRVRLNRIYYNHSAGTERNAAISIAGVRMIPMVGADLIVNGSVLIGALDQSVMDAVTDEISGSGAEIKDVISTDISSAITAYNESTASLYATKTDIEEVESAAESIGNSVREELQEGLLGTNTALQGLVDDFTTRVEEQDLYIQLDGSGILLGQRDSPFKVKITNTEMAFLQDGLVVAYVSNNKLYTTDVEVRNNLALGTPLNGWYDFIPRSNGNLSFKYRS